MAGAVDGLDLSGLVKRLESLAASSVKLDLSQALAVAGQLLVSDARQCFVQGRDPAGNEWQRLKNPSKKRGGPSAKPLRNTGRLMASITSGSSGNRVVVGTNVAYAAYHQKGTRTIPARPFLGVSVTTRQRIVDLVAMAAAQQLRKA